MFAESQRFQFFSDAKFSTEIFQSNMFPENDYETEIKDNVMWKY